MFWLLRYIVVDLRILFSLLPQNLSVGVLDMEGEGATSNLPTSPTSSSRQVTVLRVIAVSCGNSPELVVVTVMLFLHISLVLTPQSLWLSTGLARRRARRYVL